MHVSREASAFAPALPEIVYHRCQDWGSARGLVGHLVDVHLAASGRSLPSCQGQGSSFIKTNETGSRFLHWSVTQAGDVQIRFMYFSGQ